MNRSSLGKRVTTAFVVFCLLGNLFHLVSHFYTGLPSPDTSVELCLEDGSAEHKQATSTQHQDCLACQSFQLHTAETTELNLYLAPDRQTDAPTWSLSCAVTSLLRSTALKRGPPSLPTFS